MITIIIHHKKDFLRRNLRAKKRFIWDDFQENVACFPGGCITFPGHFLEMFVPPPLLLI